MQLPPVEKGQPPQWQYAFQCPAWKDADFKEVDMNFSWRQEDQTFVNALNVIRFGQYPKEVRLLFRPCIGRELDMPTHLVSTNKEADEINFALVTVAAGFAFIKWWEWRRGAAKRDFQSKMRPNAKKGGFVGDRMALARWKGISTAGMHELNREEVERLLAKADADGPTGLTAGEREYLDRMADS